MIPGHAFLGIELNDELLFLESTFLGYSSYKEATEFAKNEYYKYFNDELQAKVDNPNFSHIVIKVKEARKTGIYPMM